MIGLYSKYEEKCSHKVIGSLKLVISYLHCVMQLTSNLKLTKRAICGIATHKKYIIFPILYNKYLWK